MEQHAQNAVTIRLSQQNSIARGILDMCAGDIRGASVMAGEVARLLSLIRDGAFGDYVSLAGIGVPSDPERGSGGLETIQ